MSPRKKSPPVDDLALPVEPDTTIRNLACERAILGACLESDQLQDCVFAAGIVEPLDFSLTEFQRVSEAIKDLREQALPADIISVSERLGNKYHDYCLLSDLISGIVLNARHILHHCEIVRSKARLRRIRDLSTWVSAAVAEPLADPNELIPAISEKLACL